jgi:hypothetical protein
MFVYEYTSSGLAYNPACLVLKSGKTMLGHEKTKDRDIKPLVTVDPPDQNWVDAPDKSR